MIDSPVALANELAAHQLLSPAQLAELTGLQARCPDAQALARELVKRGWLTPYQVNRLFQGQADELFLGPYVLLARLGEGGMGQVFKARHRLMNRVVALKIIRKERSNNPGSADRFVREIQAAAHLSHPHIVIAHDAGRAGDVLYFGMEYVAGPDLERLVGGRGPLPPAEACEYIRQAALGLQHAHERGLVHRDVKPANLLLAEKEGVVKVLDLGLALLNQPEAPSPGLTQEGSLMGTPDYMAPEQALDCHSADARSDVYSLGCTFYFLLAGQAPFADRPTAQKIGAHVNHAPRPIEERRPDLPRGLGDVLRKMMAKRPEDRYQKAGEVVTALEPFAWQVAAPGRVHAPAAPQASLPTLSETGGPTPEVTASTGPPPSRWTRRHFLIGGAAGLALLVPAGYFLWPRRPRRKDRGGGEEVPGQDRYSWYPRELIRALGDDRGRHWGPVRSVAYRSDGKLIASGGDDAVIRLWAPETLRETRLPLRGHSAAVRAVVFSPDGKYLLSLGNDGTMRLWDTDSGQEVRRFAGSEQVGRLYFSADGQWARGLIPVNNGVTWASWEVSTALQGGGGGSFPNSSASSLAWTDVVPGGHYVVYGETTPNARTWYQVCVWNTVTGKVEHTLPGPEKPAGYDDLKPAEKARVPVRLLQSVSSGLAGKRVLTASRDGELTVWDLSAEPRRLALAKQEVAVSWTALTPDGRLAIIGTQDGALHVHEVDGARKRGVLAGHKGGVVAVTFSPDSSRALTASDDRTLRQWDLATCKELAPRAGHTHLVEDVAFSPDGKRVLSGGADRTMRLWEVATGEQVDLFAGHKSGVSSVAFLPSGQEVFSSEALLTARRWAVADGRILFSFSWEPTNPPTALLYSRKGPHALVAHFKGGVARWDLTAGRIVGAQVVPSMTAPACVAASQDGRYALCAGADPLVRYLDLVDGQERNRFGGHTDAVLAVAFSPDERYALSAGKDRSLRRWELKGKGKPTQEVELEPPLPKVITCMTFSPDTTLLACTGVNDYEGLVLLWDTQTGRLRARWPMPGPVQRLTFADDSEHLATANANGTVYVYRLDRAGKD